MRERHSCACAWSAIAIFLAMVGSCLKVHASGGSSLKDTSWAMSARVQTFNVPIWLIATGIIFKFAWKVPSIWRASLRGS